MEAQEVDQMELGVEMLTTYYTHNICLSTTQDPLEVCDYDRTITENN